MTLPRLSLLLSSKGGDRESGYLESVALVERSNAVGPEIQAEKEEKKEPLRGLPDLRLCAVHKHPKRFSLSSHCEEGLPFFADAGEIRGTLQPIYRNTNDPTTAEWQGEASLPLHSLCSFGEPLKRSCPTHFL